MNLEEEILLDLEKNPVLKTGFFENENRGNNTFNFSKGKKIFIPGVKIGGFEDLKFGNKIAFEDFDENYENGKNGEKILIKESGFENFLWILNHKNKENGENFPPIFICDNHNHVLESWKFFKGEKTKLIHIDQHKDNANYKKPILDFRRDLRICDYINYAIDEKWVNKDYISLCENIDFNKYFVLNGEENFFNHKKKFSECGKFFLEFEKNFLQKKSKNGEEKIILNIDLDIFVDHQTILNHEKLFEFINFLKDKVDLISIASSPLFLKKDKVLLLIEKILKI